MKKKRTPEAVLVSAKEDFLEENSKKTARALVLCCVVNGLQDETTKHGE
jgi:hypothetical protein